MAVDLSKLSFQSNSRYERISIKSHIGFSVAAFGATTYTIAHNLGYLPYVKAYYTYDNVKFFELFSGNRSYAMGGNGGQIDTAYVDTVNYYVKVSENSGAAISGTIYYRIYAEPQV